MTRPPRILTIAGSDPTGGAGIQADIKTITMLGGFAMTAITAITVQTQAGVSEIKPLAPALVAAQISACVADIGVDAVKIGMLATPAIAHGVAAMLATPSLAHVPVVFDPVMLATSGGVLADADTIAAFMALLARADLVTPNLPELVALGGEGALRQRTRALLVKGGHGTGATVIDRLLTPDGERCWQHPRLATRHTHGTGCTLASAIACGLGAELALEEAVARAIAYVAAALATAPGYGEDADCEDGEGAGPIGHTLGLVPAETVRESVPSCSDP